MKLQSVQKLQHKDLKTESSLLWQGIAVGLLAGIAGIAYRLLISEAEDLVASMAQLLAAMPQLAPLWLVALCVLAVLCGFVVRAEPHAGGSGIPQVCAEVAHRLQSRPERVLLGKFVGGTLAAGGGLSLGREGPSIQLGAMCGKLISRWLRLDRIREQYLLTCGAAAGLSVAFNAPVSGVLFSLEEIHRYISKKLIISCFSAALTADILSHYVFGLEPILRFPAIGTVPIGLYPRIVLLGVVLGLASGLYYVLMQACYRVYGKLGLYIVFRPIPAFLVSFVLFLAFPAVLGGGSTLLPTLLANDHTWLFLLVLFAVKLLFSLISFTSGVPGGIFLPILIQGGILGCLFAQLFGGEFNAFFIVLAMAGYLTAVMRNPLTSMLLIFEMTQRVSYFLPLAICCLCAYYTANALGTKPIYEYLLQNLLRTTSPLADGDPTMIQVVTPLPPRSRFCGVAIRDLRLPPDVLITKIDRTGGSTVARGATVLQPNDRIVFVMPRAALTAFRSYFHTDEK